MLVPALLHKGELLGKFVQEMYTDKYFYYSGYGYSHELPNIEDKCQDCVYQYAVVDRKENVLGWFAYRIYPDLKSVENFGLYAFKDSAYSAFKSALILGRDVYNEIQRLIQEYHRVSWRVISGNPVIRSYDKLYKQFSHDTRFHTNRVELHDVTIDPHGNYHNEIIYEIINTQK